MASITQERPGHWRIKYAENGHSKGIRLGRCSKHDASSALTFIGRLIAAKKLASVPDGETIAWLNRLDDTIRNRLVNAGLTPPRQAQQVPTLKELIDRFKSNINGKPSTHAMYRHTGRNLLDFLTDRPLNEVTNRNADEFRNWLKTSEQLAEATIGRRIKAARTIWKTGQRWKMTEDNPFTGVKGGQAVNDARKRFVPVEDVQRLIDACPDAQWRLIIALARFAGVRIPSEILPLRWADIFWDTRKIRITSPKTERLC